MFIIVGLGNPGDRYATTRHNIGFMVIDYLAERLDIKINKLRHKALIGEGYIGMDKVILVKPQTYMNLSGQSVLDIVEFYKTPLENLIVVYDDVDLNTGSVRIRPRGSSGTHNGMKSIIYLLNDDGFKRVRVGIGKAPEFMDLSAYVLGKLSKDEIPLIGEAIKKAASALEEIVKNDIDLAMSKYNG